MLITATHIKIPFYWRSKLEKNTWVLKVPVTLKPCIEWIDISILFKLIQTYYNTFGFKVYFNVFFIWKETDGINLIPTPINLFLPETKCHIDKISTTSPVKIGYVKHYQLFYFDRIKSTNLFYWCTHLKLHHCVYFILSFTYFEDIFSHKSLPLKTVLATRETGSTCL